MNSNNIKQSVVKLETPLSFGSVCSGIEAASVAWEPLGWRASWFAEIEQFPSAVLAYHWPQVVNLGDMTKIRERVSSGEVSAPDVLVGGTPCQAFSVAGARKSLSDDRGQLTLEYVRLLNEIDAARSIRGEQPAIAVWENVPGVLNTKDNAFGCLLGALAGEECELQPSGKKWGNAGCVFGPQRAVAWRVLDAQYFGVAQRRRRVFVVASAREGFNPAEVLFEWEGVRRDTPPSRSSGKKVTGSVGKGFAESSFAQFRPTDGDCGTLKRSGGVLGGGSEAFIVTPQYANGGETCDTITRKWAKGSGGPDLETKPLLLVGANDNSSVAEVCIPLNSMTMLGRPSDDLKPRMGLGVGSPDDPQNTLSCNHHHAAFFNGAVRRLTPIECERLQGFPDNHTQIPYRNKPAEQCPDGPRYAACGNSMAVPVMNWIGRRIQDVIMQISL